MLHISNSDIKNKRVLEVGSYDVNGSLRPFICELGPSEYIGIDIEHGPCVDRICRGEDLVQTFGENSFDFVLSTNTLEHIENWKPVVSNMKRVCKTGGAILVIVPSRWPIHNYPSDYWRFSRENLKHIFSDFEIEISQKIWEEGGFMALSYIKCRKPESFKEMDLSKYDYVTHVPTNILVEED